MNATSTPSEAEPAHSQPGQLNMPDDAKSFSDVDPSSTTPPQIPWLNDALASVYASGKEGSNPGIEEEETSGSSGTVKTLYEGPSKCDCCINWVEDYPDNTKESNENTTEAKRHALLVRMKLNHDGPRPVSIHSIVIQSSLLKVVLQQVFDHYPGVAVELDNLVFEAPFQCFFHRWDRLEACLKDTECQTTREHLLLLHNIIQEELKEAVARYQDLTSHRLMRFTDLWMIFNPDVIVFLTGVHKQGDQLGRLKSTSYKPKNGQSVFKLRLSGVAWDGDDIGYTRSSRSIPEFDGTTPIRDLKAYPLNYHQYQNELCERLIARGRKYQGLAGVSLVTCKGLAWGRKQSFFDKESMFTEDGRVVIDPRSFGRQHPNEQIQIIPLDSESTTIGAEYWDCGDSTNDTSEDHLPQQAKQVSPQAEKTSESDPCESSYRND
ncbi:MAG: hypothetical protein Q9180_005706 [Flavoplaca navasiana]